LGGTVNIITKNPDQKKQLKFRLEGSNHDRLFSSFNMKGGYKKLYFSLSAAYDKANDFRLSDSFSVFPNQKNSTRDNSDFKKKSISAKLHYSLNFVSSDLTGCK